MVGKGRVHLRLAGVLVFALLPLLASIGSVSAAPAAQDYEDRQGVLTIRSFELQQRWVALTFDARADRGETAHALEFLADEGVHASFGVTGVWAQQNPDLVRWMVRDGHSLINLGWDYTSFTTLTSAQRVQQLQWTEDAIRQIAGVELPPFFRAPNEQYDDGTLADLGANGYATNILWSIHPGGESGGNPIDIAHEAADNVVPGSIVLMHLDSESHDVFALSLLIDLLQERGYQFGTVDDFVLGSLLPMRYFPATGYWVRDNILAFWDDFGGLPVFGYPISEARSEGNATVQYFERARFEYRPGSWPSRYDVLLGRLGVELTAGRENEKPFRPVNAATDANCTFYPETGHRLCFGFRDWWSANGGLMIFGYPISEEFVENGYTVQYFERARFEWHPENANPWKILLGHLGRDALEQAGQ